MPGTRVNVSVSAVFRKLRKSPMVFCVIHYINEK